MFGKTWLYVIFIAISLIAMTNYLGSEYFSPEAVYWIEFWIGIVALIVLTSFAALDTNFLVIPVLMLLLGTGMAVFSFGNIMFGYDLPEFWKATMNANGMIAGLAIIRISYLDLMNCHFHDYYKRHNRLLDDMEEA